MSPGATALAVIAAIVGAGSVIGFCARGRHRMDLEQWTVGGRSFGLVVLWLLMAGEVYTTAAFLGTCGWVYSKGAPSLYIIAYLVLGNAVAFFVSPAIWRVGRARGLQTQADFFQAVYGSRTLGALVAFVGIAAIIPYLQLQLTGLGIIVSVASFGGISQALAMTIAAALIAGFVLASGIRAVAGMSFLKDLLMIGVVVGVGAAVPRMLFGGVGPMFARILAAHPDHLTMPGPVPALGHGWFVTTVLLSALGPTIWPHSFGSIFSGGSAETVRRNSIVMPLYNLTLPFSFFVGYAALVAMPGLADSNMAFMAVVKSMFPPWLLGLVGGAGALAAMVPASVMLLTAATLFAKNVVRPILAPSLGDVHVARLARGLLVALTGLSLWFALHSSATLLGLLQLGYGMVGQFFPGIVLGLFWGRAHSRAVLSGIVSGLAALGFLELTGRDPLFGMAAGFLALGVNFCVTIALSHAEFGRRADLGALDPEAAAN
jgi:solute:Na+ symporter, SSS family